MPNQMMKSSMSRQVLITVVSAFKRSEIENCRNIHGKLLMWASKPPHKVVKYSEKRGQLLTPDNFSYGVKNTSSRNIGLRPSFYRLPEGIHEFN
jgi:hypothetical protein